jgi:hypothetical protein
MKSERAITIKINKLFAKFMKSRDITEHHKIVSEINALRWVIEK